MTAAHHAATGAHDAATGAQGPTADARGAATGAHDAARPGSRPDAPDRAGGDAPLGWGSFEGLPTGRTLVMGVLNVTPDSFSDGGRHDSEAAAIAHGLRLAQQGADIVDVGGESTRPHARQVDPREERRRVLPVIRELSRRGVVVSADTLHADTAYAAIEAGAHIVNDVSGTAVSAEMVELVGATGVPYVLMHSRGTPQTMTGLATYTDTVADVLRELTAVRDRLLAAGAAPERLVLDPGLGFAKAGTQDWELLRALPRLQALGHRVLVAASRKRFLGALLAEDGEPRPVDGRDGVTAALSALAAFGGAWAVRVHDVPATVDAVATAHAWLGIEPPVLRPRDAGS